MPSQTALSEQQVDVVTLVEQTFFLHGKLPTNEFIADKLGISVRSVAKYWNDDKFREALMKRGVDLRPAESRDLLTAQQLTLANMLLNTMDKQSVRQKLEAAGVTAVQYNNWLTQPAFRDYLAKRAEQMFQASQHEAYMSLSEVMKGGDVPALKLYFEMTGKYTPRAQLDVNIESVMVRIVEIIARHVQDANVIEAIANDIETLTMGKVNSTAPLSLPPSPSPGSPVPPSPSAPDLSF